MSNLLLTRFKKAMTLTEVVIAMALVALSIGGIMSVIVQSMTLEQSVDSAYVAMNLAKNRIERIREIRRDRGYAAVANTEESDTVLDRNGVSDPNGEFMRTTVIDAAYATDLTKVTVSVKFKRKNVFIPQSIELETLISPYT